jgi:hypothetical protein
VYVFGVVQAAKMAPSSEQRKVCRGPDEWNVNVAVLEVVVAGGLESMVVSGAAAATPGRPSRAAPYSVSSTPSFLICPPPNRHLRAASLIPGTLDRRQVLVVDKVAAATQVEAAEVIVASAAA